MRDLKIALTALIKTLHPRVWYQSAPQSAVFPYVVYELAIYPDGEGGELVTLDVDMWDSSPTGDTSKLDALCDMLKPLDKKVILTDTFGLVFFLDSSIGIPSENKELRHIKSIYSGKLTRR